jgi:oligopeptide transport system substrate-binding protein
MRRHDLIVLLFSTMCACSELGAEQIVVNTLGVELPPDAAPLTAQTLRLMAPEPRTLDATLDNYGTGGSQYIFERLALLDEEDQLIPGAADRWVASDDARTWTFYLRPDGRWSDGRPVTAHDFEWTYKLLLDPVQANVYAFLFYEIKGARDFNQRRTSDRNTVGVRAIDDYTLVIEAEQTCPYLPYLTSFISASPIPRWQFEKYGNKWTEEGNCVRNFTFKLDEWTTGRQQVFVLDPNYTGRYKALLEKVIIQFTTGTSVGIFPYENNEVDMAAVTPADLPRVTSDEKLRSELYSWPHQSTGYLLFQTKKPPFDQVKVRQAIAHAIDRETLCGVVMQGLATPAYSMLPLHFPGYNGDRFKSLQAFDPVQARQLLAEAGYPNGKGFPDTVFWISGNAQTTRQISQAIQGMIKMHLNIDVPINTLDGTSYMSYLYQHQIPFGLSGFQSDYPDPHNLLSMVWHSQPVGYGRHDWVNPTFDRLLEQADTEINPNRRLELYAQAEQILVEEAGGVFLYHGVKTELRKPWIKGIPKIRTGHQPFWTNYITHTRVYIGNNRR